MLPKRGLVFLGSALILMGWALVAGPQPVDAEVFSCAPEELIDVAATMEANGICEADVACDDGWVTLSNIIWGC